MSLSLSLRMPLIAKRSWHAILFAIPLALVFAPPALAMWLGGEFTRPATIVHRQMSDTPLVLFGDGYAGFSTYVKSLIASNLAPKLLVLGNSRVMQFRRNFFLPGANFYNAGGTIQRLQHFRAFLQNLPPDRLPQTLLIATDTGFFNAGFDQLDEDLYNLTWMRKQLSAPSGPIDLFFNNWSNIWADVYQRKVKWPRLFSFQGLSTRVGFNALFNDAGYRNDGSYQYGVMNLGITDPKNTDFQFAYTLKLVAAGSGRFCWGTEPSGPALAELDALLDFCTAHHIHVIAFMPPHAHAVWLAMKALGDRYAYIGKLEPALRGRFAARGFEFYDYCDLADVGAPDSETFDGYHGNERAYLRLTISMLERGSRLNAYADLPKLEARLQEELKTSDSNLTNL